MPLKSVNSTCGHFEIGFFLRQLTALEHSGCFLGNLKKHMDCKHVTPSKGNNATCFLLVTQQRWTLSRRIGGRSAALRWSRVRGVRLLCSSRSERGCWAEQQCLCCFNGGVGPAEVFAYGTYETIGPVWSPTLCPCGCQRSKPDSLNRKMPLFSFFWWW